MKHSIYKNWSEGQMKRTIRRIMTGCMAVVLCCTLLLGNGSGVRAQAATFDDINQSSVFLKQASGSKMCTLVSATMLIRRAAMLNGNANWSLVTTDTMTSAAWVTGAGLKWDFNCAGIKVTHASFSGSAADLAVLLAAHPEGVVLYKQKSDQNHAVLVTDYTDGVFYCADPSGAVASGRIPISSASITVEDSNYVWYATSPDLYLEDASGNIISHETVDTSIFPSSTPKATETAKPTATAKPSASPKAEEEVSAPNRVSSLYVKNTKKKTLTMSWKKVTDAEGYQVFYSTQKSFKEKNASYHQGKTHTVSKLTRGEVYYVKVRAYKLDGKKKVFGKCSKIKKAKVKK